MIENHNRVTKYDSEKITILELKLAQTCSDLEVSIKLQDLVWVLSTNKLTENLDFTLLREDKGVSKFWTNNFGINIEHFVKEAVITDAHNSNLKRKKSIRILLRRSLRNIFLMLSYIQKEYDVKKEHDNAPVINRNNLADCIAYILTNDWKNNEITPRYKPLSYNSYTKRLELRAWKGYLRNHFITNIIDLDLVYSDEKYALKKAFKSINYNKQTFSDWKSGSSLNTLTLDVGQYYVEHCLILFSQNNAIVASMLKAIEDRVDIGMKLNCNIEFSTSSRWKTICEQLVCGLTPKQSLLKGYGKVDLNQAYKLLNKSYRFHGRPIIAASFLYTEKSVSSIANRLGIKNNTSNRDALSMFIDLWGEKKLNDFTKIIEIRFPNITIEALALSIETEQLVIMDGLNPELLKLQDWKDLGFDLLEPHSQRRKSLNQLVDSTIAAATTACLAFTGWRTSEFGFSKNDIQIEENLDLLDQQAFPFRIYVNWHVPKTHGQTLKQKREITQPTYKLLKNLSMLTAQNDNEPIFQSSKTKTFVKSRLYYNSSYLWTHFAKHYPPFLKLDKLRVSNTASLGSKERNYDRMLLKARNQVREELPRVSLFLSRFERRVDLRYGTESLIWLYKNGTLVPDQAKVFDHYLGKSTKEQINKLENLYSINTELTRIVYQEVIDDCAYPTPHAFRHMWAESVYRRFDGDVGWMIRSNFKHVSKNMWHAYIRGKKYATSDKIAKSSFKSSMVNRILHSQSNKFTGQFVKRVRRLFNRSKIETPHSLNLKVNQFCEDEITDVKATPWGYCMMMRRNRPKSKCSVNGAPQQHRATPKLCMTCQNHMANSKNLDYIILHIAKDIEIISNDLIPMGLRNASFSAIKSARNYINNMKPDHPMLEVIEKKMHEFTTAGKTNNV